MTLISVCNPLFFTESSKIYLIQEMGYYQLAVDDIIEKYQLILSSNLLKEKKALALFVKFLKLAIFVLDGHFQ